MAAWSLLGGGTALAHESADIVVVSPAAGGSVSAPVSVVLEGAGAFGSARITVELDGDPVDAKSGVVGAGATFTTLSVNAGERRTIVLPQVADGEHRLTVRYAFDPDNPKPDLVRTFRVGAAPRGSAGRWRAVLVGITFVLLMAAAVTLRRRGLRQR